MQQSGLHHSLNYFVRDGKMRRTFNKAFTHKYLIAVKINVTGGWGNVNYEELHKVHF
jgi:hypothetical protein